MEPPTGGPLHLESVEVCDLTHKKYVVEVKNPEGRLIRRQEIPLSPAGKSDAEMTSLATWYAGGMEFIRAEEHPRDRRIDIRYLNPFRRVNPDVVKTTTFLPIHRFNWNTPQEHLSFYRSLDTFFGAHQATFDLEDWGVTVDGRSFSLETEPGTETCCDAERFDKLAGVVHFAPFLPLIAERSPRLFLGYGEELEGLALMSGASEDCIRTVWETVGADLFGGHHCFRNDMIFLRSNPARCREGRLGDHHGTIVTHELGHVIPIGSQRFQPVFRNYAAASFREAGVPKGPDLAFLTTLIEEAEPETDDDWERLEPLWQSWSLENFFPNRYSLTDGDEFLRNLIQLYRPWHRFEADQKQYYGFFRALDSLAETGDRDRFFETIAAVYPDLPVPPPPPVPEPVRYEMPEPGHDWHFFAIPIFSGGLVLTGGWLLRSQRFLGRFLLGTGLGGLALTGAMLLWECWGEDLYRRHLAKDLKIRLTKDGEILLDK